MPGARKLIPRLDWPLLGKELLEQAARRQMYIVRVVYGMVLFGAFCFYYARHLEQGPVLTLGGGRGPFQFLVGAQLATIYLFLPPLMAGALAQEKERDTLGLLFLTDLTPWELILQKYFGRLIPMLTLLFLSLPLLAVTYSLGGVSSALLCYSAFTLFLTCLWVGALALECSAHEATTFQALIRCWGFCLAFAACCWMGPLSLGPILYGAMGTLGVNQVSVFPLLISAVVYLIPTVLFLIRARDILERRAFVQRHNPFGHQFKKLDQYWKDLRKLIRAIRRRRDGEALALAAQVVQKELGATIKAQPWSLGEFLLMRMQVPNLLAGGMIFGVIVLIILIANVMLDPKSGGGFAFVVDALWIFMLLTVPIQSANAVASERMNERIGPILTTPLTAREILDEWLAPVRRWNVFLARPLIVVFAVEAMVKFSTLEGKGGRWTGPALYLAVSLLTVWIYPALAQWTCFWLGLRIRNQIRALMTSLLLVVAWCVIPIVASGYLVETGLLPPQWEQLLRYVSPVTVIGTAEAIGRSGDGAATSNMITMAFIALGIATAVLLAVRQRCLTNSDRYLGRI